MSKSCIHVSKVWWSIFLPTDIWRWTWKPCNLSIWEKIFTIFIYSSIYLYELWRKKKTFEVHVGLSFCLWKWMHLKGGVHLFHSRRLYARLINSKFYKFTSLILISWSNIRVVCDSKTRQGFWNVIFFEHQLF